MTVDVRIFATGFAEHRMPCKGCTHMKVRGSRYFCTGPATTEGNLNVYPAPEEIPHQQIYGPFKVNAKTLKCVHRTERPKVGK